VAFEVHAESDTTGTWTTACTDTAAPYTCSVNTTTTPDGLYEIRAVATDALGHATTSGTVTALRVDNTAPSGKDVVGANGGTRGKLDAGDTITFTTSEALSPASVLSGWSGAATPISVVVANSAGNDLITLTGVNLIGSGSLQTHANWVSGTVTYQGTIQQSGSQIVVTLTSTPTTGVNANVNTSAQMTWPTSTGATDLAGNPLTAATITQATAKVNF
jgi:hypothetical protein